MDEEINVLSKMRADPPHRDQCAEGVQHSDVSGAGFRHCESTGALKNSLTLYVGISRTLLSSAPDSILGNRKGPCSVDANRTSQLTRWLCPSCSLFVTWARKTLDAKGLMPVDRCLVDPMIAAIRGAGRNARADGDYVLAVGYEIPRTDVIGNPFLGGISHRTPARHLEMEKTQCKEFGSC